jgi:translation initiation factor 2 beta subunit (eIF-2beta)/eIF-5
MATAVAQVMSQMEKHSININNSVFVNYGEFLTSINRNKDRAHFLTFLYDSLRTKGSQGSSDRLILRGKYDSHKVDKVLKQYINRYVTCRECKGNNTIRVRGAETCPANCVLFCYICDPLDFMFVKQFEITIM